MKVKTYFNRGGEKINMETQKILENYELGEKESAQFVPQPGYTGKIFDDGEFVCGHATVFDGDVVKVRLFEDKDDADRDFNEFPHPHAYSIRFDAVLRRDNNSSWIESVSVKDTTQPKLD